MRDFRLGCAHKVQEVTKEGFDKDVAALRQVVSDRLGAERVQLWLGPDTVWSLVGAAVRIGLANQSQLNFVRRRFLPLIIAACREHLGPDATLELAIAAGNCQPSAAIATAIAASPVAKSQPVGEAAGANVVRAIRPASAVERRWLRLPDFVPGAVNRLVYNSARLAAEQPGRHSPLFFYGPTGVGKTHLLEGLCEATRQAQPRAGVLYLTAEQFTSQFVAAAKETGLPSFRRKFRGIDLLALDDLAFFENKTKTLIEVQYLLSTLLGEGRQLALAADRPLAELEFLGPELMGRLRGGLTLRVDPPDFEARVQISRNLARQRCVDLPAATHDFIASFFVDHARSISGAVHRLKAVADLHSQPLTVAETEEALADLVRHQRRVIRLADIDRAVCEAFGLEQRALQEADKSKRLAQPRMLAMFLARKYTRAALGEIGRYFGQRSHSSVIGAQKKVSAWLADGQSLAVAHRQCPAEETLRRIEIALRVG